MTIDYRDDSLISPEQFIDVLRRSTLAERRPVEDHEMIERMLRGADVLITAWDRELLIGVSRGISDFSYCTYLSDLAVDVAYQRRGVGKELIRLTHEATSLDGALVLLAAPAAEQYYPRIGMRAHNSCWLIPGRKTPS